MEMCKTLLGFAHFHRHRRHEPKQQNRTLHLLQKPDIFICYRHSCDWIARAYIESPFPPNSNSAQHSPWTVGPITALAVQPAKRWSDNLRRSLSTRARTRHQAHERFVPGEALKNSGVAFGPSLAKICGSTAKEG